MKVDSNYYDDKPLSTRAERLTLLFIAIGMMGVTVYLYALW